jgi:hypothetical protein
LDKHAGPCVNNQETDDKCSTGNNETVSFDDSGFVHIRLFAFAEFKVILITDQVNLQSRIRQEVAVGGLEALNKMGIQVRAASAFEREGSACSFFDREEREGAKKTRRKCV